MLGITSNSSLVDITFVLDKGFTEGNSLARAEKLW
jgi:hypothetical protein